MTLAYQFWKQCQPRQQISDPIDCVYTPRLSRVSNSYGYAVAFSYASAAGSGGTQDFGVRGRTQGKPSKPKESCPKVPGPKPVLDLDLDGLVALMKAAEASIATGRGRLEPGTGGIVVGSGSASFAKVTLTFSDPDGRGLALAALAPTCRFFAAA